MDTIGIIGANGFLGKTLCKIFKENQFNITEITKENYDEFKTQQFDILINSANPSKKFWASKNPYLDFQKTVCLTADIAYNWNYEKLIQISTISAHDYKNNHPYAVNKKSAEIIACFKNSLIVRLGTIYGSGLNKGALYDLLNSKPLFVDINSEYDFISTAFVSEWILNNLNRTGIVELGACDTISLSEIASKLNLKTHSSGRLEKIYSPRIEPNMPSAKNVIEFAKNYTHS